MRPILPGILLLCAVALAPAAEVREGVAAKNVHSVKFQSESLGQERSFNILLPSDYDASARRYPTLYLPFPHHSPAPLPAVAGLSMGSRIFLAILAGRPGFE